MNSDMVNPIPHKQLAPKICVQVTPARIAALHLAATQAKLVIPIGFPKHNPINTPTATGWASAARAFPKTGTPAFAKANNGMIKKLTQG